MKEATPGRSPKAIAADMEFYRMKIKDIMENKVNPFKEDFNTDLLYQLRDNLNKMIRKLEIENGAEPDKVSFSPPVKTTEYYENEINPKYKIKGKMDLSDSEKISEKGISIDTEKIVSKFNIEQPHIREWPLPFPWTDEMVRLFAAEYSLNPKYKTMHVIHAMENFKEEHK